MSTTNLTGNKPAILFSTLTPDQPKELPLALEGFPTEISVKVGDEIKKFPVGYFEKDVIEAGDYVHPETKQTFSVDENRIDAWVNKFDQMKAAGSEVRCPVDHSDRAEDNKGFVVKMRRDGKKLKSTIQVIGEDGALLALRNRCSMKFWPTYTDEKGRQWQDAIEHVAFTPAPVITGQGPFVPIAASRGQQSDTPILYLSASRSPEMDLSKLRESIGAAKEITDEKLIELAVVKITEGKESVTLAKTKTDEAAALQVKLTAETEKVTQLSRTPNPPDPEIMADRKDNYEQRLEISVEKGEIPLSLAKKVQAKLVVDGKPSVFMLSRHAEIGARPIDFILDLFKDEKFGTPTGSQTTVQLGRNVPDGKPDENKPVTEERKKELLAMAK